MAKLNSRQRKQTELLESLLVNSDFGLSSSVLKEVLPDGQALLDVLDLPGIYSRLIGGIRGPVPNNKGVLSILAPTTLATRHDLVSSIERQLTRPLGPEINLTNAHLNVAQTRDQEARRRGYTVYAEGRILKKVWKRYSTASRQACGRISHHTLRPCFLLRQKDRADY